MTLDVDCCGIQENKRRVVAAHSKTSTKLRQEERGTTCGGCVVAPLPPAAQPVRGERNCIYDSRGVFLKTLCAYHTTRILRLTTLAGRTIFCVVSGRGRVRSLSDRAGLGRRRGRFDDRQFGGWGGGSGGHALAGKHEQRSKKRMRVDAVYVTLPNVFGGPSLLC